MAYIVNIPSLRFSDKEVYKMGDSIELSSGLAAKLIKKAYIRFDAEPQKKIITVGNKTQEKLIPEGNVEKVKEFISGIEDIELLQKMADEEAADKNRKTVIEAIYERAQELDESEDDEESDEDEDPNINLNPEDVIVNG